ncbi:Ankyrin repeat domain-containing protein 50 [Porphyridium purpureum]|uniref:Ankyrin repeat domain-containing protein 50 n=1 Tax=Porphyridium purpureum TaxID=35688 RepID=A0A5J4YR74_PORPP|nr:Ankyrin repeat domain-containing protein 50 [Porphyridium purpureum]|eukprot:POR5391..scf296_7
MAMETDTQSAAWGALPGEQKVCAAARQGDADELVRLLHLGAPVDETDDDGKTALMFASEEGHVDCVRRLIERRADVNAADRHGHTPLMRAAHYGHVECLTLLLEQDASSNVEGLEGDTPLMCAIRSEKDACACVDALISHGVDVNYRSSVSGASALVVAAMCGAESCLRVLLKCNADVDATDCLGRTALMYASWIMSKPCFDVLIEHNANIHMADTMGHTALFHAAEHGDAASVLELIQRGADVNAGLTRGHRVDASTSLLKWFEARRMDEFDNGAEVSQGGDGSTYGKTLDIPFYSGLNALGAASAQGHVKCVRILVQVGQADVNEGTTGLTPLMLASMYGKHECVRELIRLGARIEAQSLHGGELTAMILACIGGSAECVVALLEAGAQQGVPADRQGVRDAFFFAVTYLREACVIALLDGVEGFSADTRCFSGLNALHVLIKCVRPREVYPYPREEESISDSMKESLKVLRILLARGTSFNGLDRLGRTPLDCLQERNHWAWGYNFYNLIARRGGQLNHRYLDQFWSNFPAEESEECVIM